MFRVILSHSYSSSPSDETEDYKQLDSPLQVPYNLTKIPRYARVRGDIFSNLGASLAHALLLDLRAISLFFIPNIDIKNIYMDKYKIEQRLKWKTNPYEKYNENLENLFCIGVDGRTDKDTLHYKKSVWRKMEVKFWKKPKDLNATRQSQRRHQMRVYIWLTGFFLVLVQLVHY